MSFSLPANAPFFSLSENFLTHENSDMVERTSDETRRLRSEVAALVEQLSQIRTRSDRQDYVPGRAMERRVA